MVLKYLEMQEYCPFIRCAIKQKELIMMCQITLCFLVCTNICGDRLYLFKHNDGKTRIQFLPEIDSILYQYVHIKSKPHLSFYLTGISDSFPRYKRTKHIVLKQDDSRNKKLYLSVSHKVSTHICTSSNNLN
jgi:hypothetical protein